MTKTWTVERRVGGGVLTSPYVFAETADEAIAQARERDKFERVCPTDYRAVEHDAYIKELDDARRRRRPAARSTRETTR